MKSRSVAAGSAEIFGEAIYHESIAGIRHQLSSRAFKPS